MVAAASAVALGRPEPLVAALVLLGAAYAVILEIDEPPLDGRSAIVGALLLAVGELGYLSLGARTAVTDEAGTLARRIAWVMTVVLLALAAGATVLIVVDLVPHRRASWSRRSGWPRPPRPSACSCSPPAARGRPSRAREPRP